MARTTRSTKVDITEDSTALEAPQLPHTGSQLQTLAGNAMPTGETFVASEIKGLKGAWRETVDGPKKRKKDKKKKANVQPESDGLGTQTEDAPAKPEPPIQPPVARITRRQAKAQEGPYDQQNGGSIGRSRDLDFLMSLIAGRPTESPRINPNLPMFGQHLRRGANDHLFLAEEALRKATTLEVEPKELKENVKCQHNVLDPSEALHDLAKLKEIVKDPDVSSQTDDLGEDSFVDQITSRSPAKPFYGPSDSSNIAQNPLKAAESAQSNYPNLPEAIRHSDQDSFVEHITSRSPARIEDSVEALDQMEEVEEALNEMAERMTSPEKIRPKKEGPTKQVPAHRTAKRPPAETSFQSQSLRVKSAPQRTSIIKKATSMTFKPAEFAEKSSDTKSAPVRRPISQLLPKGPATSTKPIARPVSLLAPKKPTKPTNPANRPANYELPGEAVARKLKEQRERRLAQRDSSIDSFHTARTLSGPSVKSTKPLTKPAFELPGEAYSRKKREVHEAKVKAQEEEERKRREFKARPVRQSTVSSVRDTVASRGRQSKIGLEGIEDGNLTVSKRSSLNIGAHRPSIDKLVSMVANTSALRAPGPISSTAVLERKPSTKFHGPSMSGLAMQRTVSATEVQIQRQRAKEIYNRDQKLAEDIEREKREREAAAKRSREDAAERGRQASREWAERKRAKKLAEGDKGMSTGYGPGGQMGLN